MCEQVWVDTDPCACACAKGEGEGLCVSDGIASEVGDKAHTSTIRTCVPR